MTDEQIGRVVIAKLEEHPPRMWWCGVCRGGQYLAAQRADMPTCSAGHTLEPLYTVGDIRSALKPVPLARALELLQATLAVGK